MQEHRSEVQDVAAEEKQGACFLVVDDHALFSAGLTFLLERLPFPVDVMQLSSRAEMVAALERRRFDLVLIDLVLPDAFDGSMVATAVALAREAPVVVLSMLDRPEIIRQAIAGGAAGFIPKHSRPDVLLNAIRLVLVGGIYLPPAVLSVDAEPTSSPGLPAEARHPLLTDRQLQVLALVVEGRANRDIARSLGVSEATVKAHMTAIMRAVGAQNRTQAVIAALETGIV